MAKLGGMDAPDSLINRETAAVMRGLMDEAKFPNQAAWADAAGMSAVTVQKVLSGKQAAKMPQLLALIHATKIPAATVMQRIDDAIARAVSEIPISLDAHRKKVSDMSDTEIESLQGAATHNAEHEQDEQPHA